MANKARTRPKQTAASGSKSLSKAMKAAATPSTSQQRPKSSVSTSPKASVQQSVQLVQSLLHAGISCVAYLRQLFPEACFMQRTYENRDDHWDYEDWVAGGKGKHSDKKRGARVSLLKRGTHQEADRILDWLERGVFDALRKGYLKAFQFQIVQNQDRPSEVMETYDFRVRYVESTGEALVEVGVPDGKQATIASARLGFTQMIRKLSVYCPTLADLPLQRSVRIQLAYNDYCPSDYDAPGFVAGTGDSIAFPNSNGWARKLVSMGEMATGRHALSLRINHIEQRDPTVPETEIPTNLVYNDITTLLAEENADVFEFQDVRITPVDHVTGGADKEASDVAERSYLKKALQDTPADDDSPDTQPLNTTSQDLEMSSKQHEDRELSKDKLAALKSGTTSVGPSSPLKRHSTGLDLQGLGSSDEIKCDCGWKGEDPEQMLQCRLCETWQHAFCYGYLGRSDPRMPKDRLCYDCLTTGESPKLLTDLQGLALIRCGIRYIKRFGFTDDSILAEGLGIDRQNASRLSTYLRDKKFLIPLPGQKRMARAVAQGPRQIIGSGTAHGVMMDECFNPFKFIDYLYVPRSKSSGTLASSTTSSTGPSTGSSTLAAESPPGGTSRVTPKTTAEATSSQSYPVVRPSRKGKERATSQTVPSSADQPPMQAKVPVAMMQTPSRKRRSREEWAEEVGRRVTPKRACKNSVSDGFATITYMPSPMGASVDERM